MLESISRPKIRDVIAAQLRSYITEQRLSPGDRLPTEKQLAERFGVSRLSLREATTTLEFLGVVDSKPGRGLTVGKINFTRVAGLLEFHPGLQHTDALELIHTRAAIETGVVPYISERMQADESIYLRLHEINDRLRNTASLQEWIELDIAFHRLLVESSGLSSLSSFAELLGLFFRRFRESVKAAEWRKGVESHQTIIDALRDGRVDTAREELRGHIENHKTRIARTS
jgi:GntR family transcriptional regulator, transcriptional repressor for pyruvate dehydrogenase complex